MPENKEKSYINFLCETKKAKKGNWPSTSILVSHCDMNKKLFLEVRSALKIKGQL